MYKIYFYKDRKGRQPVLDYIKKLRKKSDKDSRIKITKIQDYMKVLRYSGIAIGEPYVKHLTGEIWELRPLRDRILFVVWNGNSFYMLHQFMKKTQKTPQREIEKAKKEYKRLKELEANNGYKK